MVCGDYFRIIEIFCRRLVNCEAINCEQTSLVSSGGAFIDRIILRISDAEYGGMYQFKYISIF